MRKGFGSDEYKLLKALVTPLHEDSDNYFPFLGAVTRFLLQVIGFSVWNHLLIVYENWSGV